VNEKTREKDTEREESDCNMPCSSLDLWGSVAAKEVDVMSALNAFLPTPPVGGNVQRV